ncbi:MAG: M23 family metallopeptidase [Acidimicrobiales bacterium]
MRPRKRHSANSSGPKRPLIRRRRHPAAGAGGVSASGFQWPISAYVTSEYGWRIHPIYGTKRLHAGIDLGAGTGTPIAASAGGNRHPRRPYGGYGNAVIINHGNGITNVTQHRGVDRPAGRSGRGHRLRRTDR